jgi:hypothetical protein
MSAPQPAARASFLSLSAGTNRTDLITQLSWLSCIRCNQIRDRGSWGVRLGIIHALPPGVKPWKDGLRFLDC